MKAVVPCYIGVDVSKVQLDIAVHTAGQVWQVANGPASIMELVVELQALVPDLVVLKATGGLEMALAGYWPRAIFRWW